MRSQIGVAQPYSLSVIQQDSIVEVTLRNGSGDYACTFTPVTDASGFTTFGKGGYYTCVQPFIPFRCSDGTLHSIFTFGEDISGRVSGNEMNGAWAAVWMDGVADFVGVQTKAEFIGTR
jgi:hypothetical protein